MTVFNSLIGRTDAASLIPEEVSREIISALPTKSAALSAFRRVNMSRAQQRLPVLSVLPTAYWVDGSSDTGLKQTTEVNWGNKYLDARELAVIVPVPDAVAADADYDIWGEVRPLLTEAIGAAIDAATIFNTANPWPQAATYQGGIVTQAVAAGNSVTEGTGVDFAEDVNLAFAKVEDDGFDVNIVLARRKVRSRLRGLRATTREPIYQDIAAGSPATLYGEPIEFVGNGPWVNNYEMVVGDRNMAILGIRQDITFKMFTEGVISDDSGNVILNLMQQDSAAMRVVIRLGWAVASPISLQNTNDATRFPFAVIINAGS
jgi:HK97 family phage major capsid protein